MNRTALAWIEEESIGQHINSTVCEDDVLLLMVLNAYAEAGIA